MNELPSFQPSKKNTRPDSEGAQILNGGIEPRPPLDHTRVMKPPSPGIPPIQPPLAPPSFPPPKQNSSPVYLADPAPSYLPAQGQGQAQGQSLNIGGSTTPPGFTRQNSKPKTRKILRNTFLSIIALIAIILSWVLFLFLHFNSQLQTLPELASMNANSQDGTTYLLAGSDERDGGVPQDGTAGKRSDTIIVVNVAPNGQSSITSIPRDSYVKIPGHSRNKINASYSFGGPALLIKTVENLTKLSVDHYIEVGMHGVIKVVDAVGGVQLCYDRDVDEPKSGMKWSAGCHLSDGTSALAFSRMRYADPLGDVGRAKRQREVVGAALSTALAPRSFIDPARQLALVNAVTHSLYVDPHTSALDLVHLAFALRQASSQSLTGAPPISSLGYRPGSVGATVQLDPKRIDDFLNKVRNGTLTPTDYQTPAGG